MSIASVSQMTSEVTQMITLGYIVKNLAPAHKVLLANFT
jgi:hypothetical protein